MRCTLFQWPLRPLTGVPSMFAVHTSDGESFNRRSPCVTCSVTLWFVWHAGQYLKFEQERTQACRDLVSRIDLDNVRRIVDLGCGPGTSTAVLRERWPDGEIIGVDNSTAMIEKARASDLKCTWILDDVAGWAAGNKDMFDLLFANAALHWVPKHREVIPSLLWKTRALAVQMPVQSAAPAHRLLREMAASDEWAEFFRKAPEWYGQTPAFYYDLLAGQSRRLDIWETDYIHLMPNVEAIVEWYKGSGLRPYLDALPDEAARNQFTGRYLQGLRRLYPTQADGRVLFPFRRLFFVVYS
jgi:trans-aconitate 2-methyltransferase